MKFHEMKKLNKEELNKKMVELRTELMKLNAQVAIGTTPKSTKQIREIKRTIAKTETLRMQEFHKDIDALKTKKPKVVKKYTNH